MDASLGKIRYTNVCHITVTTHINACQSPAWLSYRSQANDASVSWEHDPPILIDCRWMHPWARYDIPTSVILLLPLISMIVSPRHDSPIAANDASVSWEHDPPILIDCRWMHPWARYDIPTSVILLLSLISMLVSPWHDSPIAAMPMMHLSDKSILWYWSTVDGCIPRQETIYQHLSYYC